MNYSEEYKQQVYKKWLAGDRAFYHIDPKKEPERENARANSKLAERSAQIKQKRRVNQVKEYDRLMRGEF